jgi:hypothetical protein
MSHECLWALVLGEEECWYRQVRIKGMRFMCKLSSDLSSVLPGDPPRHGVLVVRVDEPALGNDLFGNART